MRVRVDTSGRPAVVVMADTTVPHHELLAAGPFSILRLARWRPARRFGRIVAGAVTYEFVFVLVADSGALAAQRRGDPRTARFATRCPTPRGARQVVVCERGEVFEELIPRPVPDQ